VGCGSFLALKVGNRPGKWFQNGSLAKKEGELKNAKEIKKGEGSREKGKRTGGKGRELEKKARVNFGEGGRNSRIGEH